MLHNPRNRVLLKTSITRTDHLFRLWLPNYRNLNEQIACDSIESVKNLFYIIILQEVLNAYEILRAEFPNAELHAGNLEDFFVAANAVKDKLPIFTNEIGDTWIQGVASDPRKCAEYRAVSRVMKDCVASGYCKFFNSREQISVFLFSNVEMSKWKIKIDQGYVLFSNKVQITIHFLSPCFNIA